MVFLTKKGLLECKPEWNREAITVFSRLPSLRRLQATPPLQTSLISNPIEAIARYVSRLVEYHKKSQSMARECVNLKGNSAAPM